MTKKKAEGWVKEFDWITKTTDESFVFDELKQFIRNLLATELRGLLIEEKETLKETIDDIEYKLLSCEDVGYNRAIKEINAKINQRLKGKFRPVRSDTKISTVEKRYGVDLGVRPDMKLGNFLKEKGYPSLSRMIK